MTAEWQAYIALTVIVTALVILIPAAMMLRGERRRRVRVRASARRR